VDDKGIRNVDRIKSEVTGILTSGRCVRLNYVEVVNRENMKTEAKVEPGRSMIVVAAWIDEVRLIDNVML
jgi:pantoate--beta-alanine ligase